MLLADRVRPGCRTGARAGDRDGAQPTSVPFGSKSPTRSSEEERCLGDESFDPPGCHRLNRNDSHPVVSSARMRSKISRRELKQTRVTNTYRSRSLSADD